MENTTKTKAVTKKAYQEALQEFRKKYFKEMKNNMAVAISIRDGEGTQKKTCPYCKRSFMIEGTANKDKNESMKLISRMLGTLQPERITTATAQAQSTAQQAQKIEKPAIKPELQKKLDALKK